MMQPETNGLNPPFDLELVSLRPASPDDNELLFKIFVGARFNEFSLLDLGQAQKHTLIKMQFDAQSYQYSESHPGAESRIISWNHLPVGRMLVDRGERETTLVDIALLPEYRNHGIGTLLIQRLLVEAAEANKQVRLHVLKSNPAQHLYERLGFFRAGGDAMYFEMLCKPVL